MMGTPFQSPVRVKRRSHAAELGERLADHVVADAELVRDRDRGGRIERVVPARHRQRRS